MSEPIPAPDKLFARMVASAALLLFAGLISRHGDVVGGTATVGFLLLVGVLGWVAALGLVYRTRWWR